MKKKLKVLASTLVILTGCSLLLNDDVDTKKELMNKEKTKKEMIKKIDKIDKNFAKMEEMREKVRAKTEKKKILNSDKR